jgi:hypothetical protein
MRGSNFISIPPVAFGRYFVEVFMGPPFLRVGLPLTEVPKAMGLAETYFMDVCCVDCYCCCFDWLLLLFEY